MDIQYNKVMYELVIGKNNHTYGIIRGNETIVFIKPGLGGSIYGYENKYFRISEKLNDTFNCTVIVSPNEKKVNFDTEMEFIKEYVTHNNLADYQIYYFGHSNGALIGMCNASKYSQIKRLLLINAPLCINPQKTIDGIKMFAGEKMVLVFGDKDPSFHFVKLFSELSNEKVRFEIIPEADHNFKNKLELFMSLPEKYLFTLSN